MGQLVLDCNQRLDDHVFGLTHNFVGIQAILLQSLKHFCQGTLVPSIIVSALGHLKVLIFFVDSIICQVHK